MDLLGFCSQFRNVSFFISKCAMSSVAVNVLQATLSFQTLMDISKTKRYS